MHNHIQPSDMVEAAHPARGRHLLLTLGGCPPALLDDCPALEALVRRAAEASGATVLHVVAHRFEPHGVTALALLAESHASLHTYPEHGAAFWDCFTCGPHCAPERSADVLIAALRPESVQQQLVERGNASL
ncbi:MAG TPA: adenosylmethionine decarboxylase [Roseiflexaceae bacterium]|nr:adenosylmethionine decarboxylase [Roseiflexaceae bacterium]